MVPDAVMPDGMQEDTEFAFCEFRFVPFIAHESISHPYSSAGSPSPAGEVIGW
jgi:hypothetical protein